MSLEIREKMKGGESREELLALRAERSYDDGRTKQSFKDSTDINKILKKAQKAGSLAHLQKYDKAVYGEFENYDLLEAMQKVDRANEIFNDLPAEIRSEFKHDALAFAKFASDPSNNDRLQELLPAIAEPGQFFPNPVHQGATGAGAATPPPETSPEATSEDPAAVMDP